VKRHTHTHTRTHTHTLRGTGERFWEEVPRKGSGKVMGKGVSRKVLVKRHGDRFWGKVLGNDSGETTLQQARALCMTKLKTGRLPEKQDQARPHTHTNTHTHTHTRPDRTHIPDSAHSTLQHWLLYRCRQPSSRYVGRV
jgi:hypothetical protein